MSPAPTGFTPGVRAFVSRETDLIAGALAEAAAAHLAFPPTAALHAVIDRIHAVQGLGTAALMSPLPELLAAMEHATRTLLTGAPPPAGIGNILSDAATALHAMAHAMAQTGEVVLPPEITRVGRRLLEGYVAEDDVVPIADLAPDGWPSVVARGPFPDHATGSPPVRVELIAVGDHLVEQGRALASAQTTVAVELRLFVLHRTLTAMPTRGGTGRFLAPVARLLARAIAAPSALTAPQRVAGMLTDCGAFLSRAAAADDTANLELARDALLVHLAGGGDLPLAPAESGELVGTPIVPIAALAPDDEGDVVPIATLAPEDEGDVVPIAALAPDPDADLDIVPIAALAPDVIIPEEAPGEPSRLELAFRRRRELTDATGTEPPSLAGLLGEAVVEVSSLLYLGEGAFSRAEGVRAELLDALADPGVSLAQLRPLLEELLDLLPLVRRVA